LGKQSGIRIAVEAVIDKPAVLGHVIANQSDPFHFSIDVGPQ
jgi:hypothetical protein